MSWAIAAEEVRQDKPNQSIAKLFAYLCKQEGEGATAKTLPERYGGAVCWVLGMNM